MSACLARAATGDESRGHRRQLNEAKFPDSPYHDVDFGLPPRRLVPEPAAESPFLIECSRHELHDEAICVKKLLSNIPPLARVPIDHCRSTPRWHHLLPPLSKLLTAQRNHGIGAVFPRSQGQGGPINPRLSYSLEL